MRKVRTMRGNEAGWISWGRVPKAEGTARSSALHGLGFSALVDRDVGERPFSHSVQRAVGVALYPSFDGDLHRRPSDGEELAVAGDDIADVHRPQKRHAIDRNRGYAAMRQ